MFPVTEQVSYYTDYIQRNVKWGLTHRFQNKMLRFAELNAKAGAGSSKYDAEYEKIASTIEILSNVCGGYYASKMLQIILSKRKSTRGTAS